MPPAIRLPRRPAILEGVMRDIFGFCEIAPQDDDLTFVVLKQTP